MAVEWKKIVFDKSAPTFTGLTVPSISPAADFALNQNSVAVMTSVSAGAIANTLYLKEGKVGIGTTSPASLLNLSYGDFRMDNEPPPSAPSVALAAGGLLTIGATIWWKVTFVTALGETDAGSQSASLVPTADNRTCNLTNIPIGSSKVTARKIYRRDSSISVVWFYMATINDNTTTTYVDGGSYYGSEGAPEKNTTGSHIYVNSDDMFHVSRGSIFIGYQAGLGAKGGVGNIYIGTEAGKNAYNEYSCIMIGASAGYSNRENSNLYFGAYAGYANVSGFGNVFVGPYAGYQVNSGYNTIVGAYASTKTTTGGYNVLVGFHSGLNCTGSNNVIIGTDAVAGANPSASGNVIIGYQAGYGATGSTNIFIGHKAGYYETGSNKLFIDNLSRTNEADARLKALIYGVFDAAVANQYLTVNGQLQVTGVGIHYFGGSVGFGGDTAPAEAVDVTGNINATGVLKIDDVQVVSNRVIDARCDDAINSGDATTDGVIDALRDAMITHGLIAAA